MMITNELIHAIERDVITLSKQLSSFEVYLKQVDVQKYNSDSLGTLHVNLCVLLGYAYNVNELVKMKRSLL